MSGLLWRASACIVLLGAFLLHHVKRQNELTRLRLEIPQIDMQWRALQERALQIRSTVQSQQTPKALLAKLQRPEFAHLKNPTPDRVWILKLEDPPLPQCSEKARSTADRRAHKSK